MIEVTNKRHGLRLDCARVYIGRPSPFGNPFVTGKDGTREQVIEKYEQWIRKELMHNSTLRAHFESLAARDRRGDNIALVCFCSPLSCHGDIIKKIVLELNERR